MTEPHDKVNRDHDTPSMSPSEPTGYTHPAKRRVRSAMDSEWLKDQLTQPGRSQSGLARFMGLLPEQVNRMCKGTRRIQASEAEKIRTYLLATSSAGATISHISQGQLPVEGLPVRGSVEAGSWREVPLASVEYTEPEFIPAPKRLIEEEAYALRVSGPSMNEVYKDGDYLIVVPFHGGPWPVGKRVVVERERDGLVETTVKELMRSPAGRLELWPRSTHPAHQEPIPLDEHEFGHVRIIGRVRGHIGIED